MPAELHLTVSGRAAVRGRTPVTAVRLQDAGLLRILQLCLKDKQYLLFARFVFQRKNEFNPFVEIARHPVGASHIDPFHAAVVEIEDPGMFQKVSYDGTHCDRLADAGYADLQAADPAYDQVDPDTGRRGFIQGRDDLPVTEGIHFGDDACRISLSGLLFLRTDHTQEPVAHPYRCHNQFIPVIRFRIAGNHIEHCRSIFTDPLVAGKETAVRILFCRRIVIVSCAQMDIPPDPVFFPADDQRDLTVRF